MYEELFASLPDIAAYLERIQYSGSLVHTPEVLGDLVFAHQKSVPFENYDICECKQPISLGIEHLFTKVVTNRRGGYCFELNGIFASLLEALGFVVTPHLAYIHRAASGEQFSPPLHRINLVEIEGKLYFTDVGFGGAMPGGAVCLDEGNMQTVQGNRYFFEKRPKQRWIIFRETSEKAIEPMISFSEYASELVDFIAPNFYTSGNPDSMFAKNRMANIRFDDGFASIGGGKFHLVRGEEDTTQEIGSKEQEAALLREYFGIVLTS